jgi:RNA polymerase sigma-B factor
VPVYSGSPATTDGNLEDLDAAALAYAECLTTASRAERVQYRDELVRYCLPFAGRLARRYRGRGEPIEDIEQVARLGLVKAIDRYDPERGSFTAYAIITISGEIKRHFRDRTWGVHVPRRLQDLTLEIGHVTTALTTTLARTPTTAEVAEKLGVDQRAVAEARESAAGYSPASLNTPVKGEDGSSGEFGDLIGDIDPDLDLVDDRITVSGLMLKLPARERRMLAMRFYGNRTQAEIAVELGISQMHVSRLLSRALAWLREAMLNDATPAWEGAGSPAEHHEMLVSVDREPGLLTVRVRGEVDRDTAERLRVALRHAIRIALGDRVVVDLSGVPLVDAAGVSVLLDIASTADAAKVDLMLSGCRPYVSRVLAVSGLATLLDQA